MQRVKSDDINADDEECPKDDKKEEIITSPIGAGLPLLQRLRLLKEKQVRFDCFNCYCFYEFLLITYFLISILFHYYYFVPQCASVVLEFTYFLLRNALLST